jgi:hypothetical protein
MNKHFQGKDALQHVADKRIESSMMLQEPHGVDIPRHLMAAIDACRETTLVLLLFSLAFPLFRIPPAQGVCIFLGVGLGMTAWKAGTSGWLGWAYLERLHRLIAQEKYEIEHHRHQEREELVALYRGKGFSGKLLDDVVDVLMADQDRLLKVMLEEEMGLTLQASQHPLQTACGAGLGALLAAVVLAIAFYFFSTYGVIACALLLFGLIAIYGAIYEGNRLISAAIWNISIGALACGITYFISRMCV